MNAQMVEAFKQVKNLSKLNFVIATDVLFILYCLGVIVYRLTLHPLARFPGPFLCRISSLQQCYYEAILNGKFLERISDYHRRYGKSTRLVPFMNEA